MESSHNPAELFDKKGVKTQHIDLVTMSSSKPAWITSQAEITIVYRLCWRARKLSLPFSGKHFEIPSKLSLLANFAGRELKFSLNQL